MRLDMVSRGRDNNLDMLRFIAAVMVMFAHAFPLSLGYGEADFLFTLTKGQIDFGGVAVSIFFFYGGFLIAQSAHRARTAKVYFGARMKRIFPPLFAVTVVLALGIGPFLTRLTVAQYYTNAGTYKYLLNSVFLLQHNLPGVFTENVYNATVNGSLWTLPIEFICYVMCWMVYKCGLLNKKYMVYVTGVFAVGCVAGNMILGSVFPLLTAAIRPAALFFSGMLHWVYRDKVWLKSWGMLIGVAVLGISAALGWLSVAIYFCLPYVLLYIGFGTRKKFSDFAKHGEISYGMYLCAFPIQQILTYGLAGVDGTMNPYINFALAVPIAVVLGYSVYWCVERPIAATGKKKNDKQ